jgi:hypothetical protein
VESDAVVVRSDDGQLRAQGGGVLDCEQVRGLGLDGPVEGLDPGLVGRGVRASEVLGDRAQRHELASRARGHLGSVVADREQDRSGLVVGADVDEAWIVAGVDGLQQPLGVEGGGERKLDLGRGLPRSRPSR